MRVTIHQPEHLPWAGFFAKASRADKLVLLDNVQFRKNYFQNRNRILTPTGVGWLTVPVLSKGHTHSVLHDLHINNTDRRWRLRCWRMILESYGRHPFFATYRDFLEDMYTQEWDLLTVLNEHVIRQFCTWLGLDIAIQRASDLNVSGSSSQLLLEICRATGATEYIAGPSARDYLDESLFDAAGIRVRHAWYEQQPYPQGGSAAFVESLSMLDVLFNCGDRSRDVVVGGSRCG
jgi:hypothetical protein